MSVCLLIGQFSELSSMDAYPIFVSRWLVNAYPARRKVLATDFPRKLVVPCAESAVPSTPVIPNLRTVVATLSFSRVLHESDNLPRVVAIAVLSIHFAVFSGDLYYSSNGIEGTLLTTSPS